MTLSEIMARHGLTWDKVQLRHGGNTLDYTDCCHKHAICTESYVERWTLTDSKFYDIIGYYPDPGVYLVKRKAAKAADSIEVKVTMDYALITNSDGVPTGATYTNFRLECE